MIDDCDLLPGPRNRSILIVDDVPANLQVLNSLLKNDYRTLIATSGQRAIELAQSGPRPDLILLDIMMPDLDGYQVCEALKSEPRTREIPVIFITGKVGLEDEVRGFQVGCVDYITKPISPPILRARVKTHLMLAAARELLSERNIDLEQKIQERTEEVTRVQAATFIAFGSLAETRDNETGNHLRRTQAYVRALAHRLKEHPRFREHLSEANIETLCRSAPLHDIGKVGIPDSILLKPDKLTPEEFEVMKTHTRIGRDSIAAAQETLGDHSEFLALAREIAYAHHEKWDGSGYPEGLKGEEIPVAARLMAVADVYDALISERVYKKGESHERAVEIILEGRGTHFDPAVVDAFLDLAEEFRSLAQAVPDSVPEEADPRTDPAEPQP